MTVSTTRPGQTSASATRQPEANQAFIKSDKACVIMYGLDSYFYLREECKADKPGARITNPITLNKLNAMAYQLASWTPLGRA
jgi:hypothetical protein